MIDFEILKSCGTTNERLREIFTASLPSDVSGLDEDKKKAIEKDIERRKKFEEMVGARLLDKVSFNLANHQIYSAVDLAWDSNPITKKTFPLMQYAQGKLDLGAVATSLQRAGLDKYVQKNAAGEPTAINTPLFYETQVNMIRSIMTRRLAAQSNKYTNLYPFYKFESRSTSLTGKLRADVISQIADIMTDNFGYREHDCQLYRDMFMYGHTVDFVQCAWEKEEQWSQPPKDPALKTKEVTKQVAIVKEGVPWMNAHPTRTFWDNSRPLSQINSDTGPKWLGYWDVMRYSEIKDNPDYWNRETVSFTSAIIDVFSTYSMYFTQYYCTVKAPTMGSCAQETDLAGANDRKNNVGFYSGLEEDASVIMACYYEKIVPKDWGVGDYPYPVWVRFVVGGYNTVHNAEILPSKPAVYAGYNENDSRQLNASMAHELMGYQDQLSNLLTYLLLVMQSNNIRIAIVNTDVAGPEQIRAFREQLKGETAYTGTSVLEISTSKLQELGIKADDVIKLVETKSNALDIIFRAIAQLISLAERMMALSPQEQGQPAPREISATETNLIAGTTESVYGFISDAIDSMRAAKKRIIYESVIALGNKTFRVPVLARYSEKVIRAAGFEPEEGEFDHADVEPFEKVQRYTVIGTTEKLEHDYIFTSRDGAERPTNTMASQTLVQLLNVLKDPIVLQGMKREQLYDIINEIFRMSGAGVDLNLETQEGDEQTIMPPQPILDQLQKNLLELANGVKQNSTDVKSIMQAIGQGQPQGQAPQGSPQGMPQGMPQPNQMAA